MIVFGECLNTRLKKKKKLLKALDFGASLCAGALKRFGKSPNDNFNSILYGSRFPWRVKKRLTEKQNKKLTSIVYRLKENHLKLFKLLEKDNFLPYKIMLKIGLTAEEILKVRINADAFGLTFVLKKNLFERVKNNLFNQFREFKKLSAEREQGNISSFVYVEKVNGVLIPISIVSEEFVNDLAGMEHEKEHRLDVLLREKKAKTIVDERIDEFKDELIAELIHKNSGKLIQSGSIGISALNLKELIPKKDFRYYMDIIRVSISLLDKGYSGEKIASIIRTTSTKRLLRKLKQLNEYLQ